MLTNWNKVNPTFLCLQSFMKLFYKLVIVCCFRPYFALFLYYIDNQFLTVE